MHPRLPSAAIAGPHQGMRTMEGQHAARTLASAARHPPRWQRSPLLPATLPSEQCVRLPSAKRTIRHPPHPPLPPPYLPRLAYPHPTARRLPPRPRRCGRHARRQRTVRAGLGAAARAAAAARRNGQAPRQGLVATRAGARRPLRSQPRPIRPPPPLPPVAPRRGGRLGCGVGADGLPRDEGWWAARGQTAAGGRACSLPPLDCGGGGDER